MSPIEGSIPDEPTPSAAQRAARSIVAPVTDAAPRMAAFIVIAGGAGSLAPQPFGVLSACAAIAAAWYVGRRFR